MAIEIICAPHIGFCHGVRRALNMAEAAARERRICTLGPLIHNQQVIDQISDRIIAVDSLDDVLHKRPYMIALPAPSSKSTYSPLPGVKTRPSPAWKRRSPSNTGSYSQLTMRSFLQPSRPRSTTLSTSETRKYVWKPSVI